MTHLINTILNSYGMLFFSKNKLFACFILGISLFTPFAGLMALLALFITIVAADSLGFNKTQVETGLLTYSVVLFGLGFATNFQIGTAFLILLIIGSLLTLFLSAALNAWFYRLGVPALSLAFIISSVLIGLASKSFMGLGLTQRHIYWYNEAYSLGGTSLVTAIQYFENLDLPNFVSGFFRSMSAILFQVNVASGILLSMGLLIYSRIAFTLMILGYTIALLFHYAMGGFQPTDLSYYNMGTNFMLVAFALGGFYLIPSKRSFAWVFITVPIAYLLVTGIGNIAWYWGIQLYSLPFCLTVILFLYILQLRVHPKQLHLTQYQYYSPETNLYLFETDKIRWLNEIYLNIQLPFMGTWKISQGHNGAETHQGEWAEAFDFVIEDPEGKTYQDPGTLPAHFYCYNKPVLAPAAGIVQEVIDHIDDNEIGGNNLQKNWGNTIIIKHAEGLYSKLSHLKKHSFKVKAGDFVKKGEILAYCGNSGRSPEPHLHFQLQSTPHVGSKTIWYPLGYYMLHSNKGKEWKHFEVPGLGQYVSNPSPSLALHSAFHFKPGQLFQVQAAGFESEEWEVRTSPYNETYLHCASRNCYAYFIQNDHVF